ncbi:MAG: extracellular solute-binding protein [Pseudomonadota bacterium]
MRHLLAAIVGAGLILGQPQVSAEPSHGLSAFGDLKYPADFTHFEYVNPDAPKGGRLSMIGTAGLITFNSFNGYILKGDAAQGLQFLFDTLMERAMDEPDAVYGLVARTVDVAADGLSATFELRPQARFSDGTPVTAEDVAVSLQLLKEKGDPRIALQLAKVEGVDVLGPHTARFRFSEANRDLPLTVATGIPVFSKAYYEKVDFSKSTLEQPLGSGPYRISDYKPGRQVTYALREDYWGRDLPVNKGRFNFGELRYEYFRDRTAEFEALKANAFDLREEFTSKVWATEYDLSAVKEGWMIKESLPDEQPSGAQGYFLNMRRAKFKDPRVRQALTLAFDFEWTNRTLFYNLYQRTNSFFENSAMKAAGRPSDEELALLEGYRGQVPAEVFEDAVTAPVTNASGQDRKMLRKASRLLKQAGWEIKDGKRVNASGEPFTIEFLDYSPSFERITAPYIKNLKILGIEAKIRLVDPAQYERRRKSFDFDVTTTRFVIRQTPGVELENYFGSGSATVEGSQNLSGISSPVVDKLISNVLKAGSREDLNTAARALDRVLRAEHFWVPHWNKAAHNMAYWNKFSRPATKPKYARGIIDTWWYDEAKAAKLDAARN